jgi:hypothetical protein
MPGSISAEKSEKPPEVSHMFTRTRPRLFGKKNRATFVRVTETRDYVAAGLAADLTRWFAGATETHPGVSRCQRWG